MPALEESHDEPLPRFDTEVTPEPGPGENGFQPTLPDEAPLGDEYLKASEPASAPIQPASACPPPAVIERPVSQAETKDLRERDVQRQGSQAEEANVALAEQSPVVQAPGPATHIVIPARQVST